MAINLNECIESLLNPLGRFAVLDGIFPVRDACGQPVMYLTSTEACFQTEYRGSRALLKVLLEDDEQAYRNARDICRATERVGSPHVETCRYLEGEMLLFDHRGHALRTDTVFQRMPAGETLHAFACRCIRERDARSLQSAVGALADLAADFHREGFVHGALTPRNLIVRPDGSMTSVNPKLCRLPHPAGDRAALAHLALMCYVFACTPEGPWRLDREPLLWPAGPGWLRKRLEKQAVCPEAGPLVRLLEMAAHPDACDGGMLTEALSHVAGLPLQRGFGSGSGLPAGAVAPACGETAGTVTAGYDRAGSLREGLVCVDDGGAWKYLDGYGNTAIPGPFLHAEDFHDGRAVVETGQGTGLIDREGRFVIEPLYEDLAWDHRAGIVMLAREGCWALFDRNGRALTGFDYDLMGECDEGLIPVRQGEKFGYLRADGTLAIPVMYDDAFGARNGRVLVRLEGRDFERDVP